MVRVAAEDALGRRVSEVMSPDPVSLPAHALAYVAQLAPTLPQDSIVLVCLSGRGDKDMETVADALGVNLT